MSNQMPALHNNLFCWPIIGQPFHCSCMNTSPPSSKLKTQAWLRSLSDKLHWNCETLLTTCARSVRALYRVVTLDHGSQRLWKLPSTASLATQTDEPKLAAHTSVYLPPTWHGTFSGPALWGILQLQQHKLWGLGSRLCHLQQGDRTKSRPALAISRLSENFGNAARQSGRNPEEHEVKCKMLRLRLVPSIQCRP